MKKIALTKGFFAVVDDEDYERVMQWKWCASIESRGTKVYAIRWSRKGEFERAKVKVRMHRFVLGLPPLPTPGDPIVLHINDDGLDNRSENLRLGTHAENMAQVERWRRKGVSTKEEPWV